MQQIKNYKESLDYLYNLSLFSCKNGLNNIFLLLNHLNNPDKNLKFIHIAGTNGKGSTSVFIYQILQQSNFKIGLFTSPHLIDFRERIRINEELISEKDVIRLVCFLQKKIEELQIRPIFFEVVTVLAFLYFQEKNVDFVVLETGLGGRLDATNVVNPIVSVITSIGFDHKHKLGKTLKEIAYEKAGIIKKNIPVITITQKKNVIEIIENTCKEKKAELIKADQSYEIIKQNYNETVFKINTTNFSIKLLGEHQIKNAILAMTTIDSLNKYYNLNISLQNIKNGLKKTKWPGRLEIISKKPLIILDGAHNKSAILILKKALLSYFKDYKIIFILGILKDKEINSMLKIVAFIAEVIITSQANSERAESAVDLSKRVKKYFNKEIIVVPQIEEAIKLAKIKAKNKKTLICITGSIYLIGEVKKELLAFSS